MRQSGPLRQNSDRLETEEATTRSSRSIDEWLAAALVEQTKRAARRDPPPPAPADQPMPRREREAGRQPERDTRREPEQRREPEPRRELAPRPEPRREPAPERSRLVPPLGASSPSEQRVIETAAKTAAALDSVTSWLERTQERLAETTRASAAAAERTEAVVTDAIGTLEQRLGEIERKVETTRRRPAFDALRTIERIDGEAAEQEQRREAPREFGEAFSSLENRVREISERIDAPRPIGRRGLSAQEEIDAAVQEIRSHQARLDEAAAAARPRRTADAPPRVAKPELRTPEPEPYREESHREEPRREEPRAPARVDRGALDELRGEIDQIHTSMSDLPTRADFGQIQRSIEALSDLPTRADLGQVERSIAAISDLPTRADLGQVERSIAVLSDDLSAARRTGAGDIEAIQTDIQRLVDNRASNELFAKLGRDIDVMSHKLDIVAASGIDPAQVDIIAQGLRDMRAALDGLLTPADLVGLGEQVSDLKLEIARIGSRQVDARDFTSLRVAFDELRETVSRPVEPALPGLDAAQLQQVTKDELQPIAAMLVTLIDKFDRRERDAIDPDSIEQIERQLAGLTRVVADTAGRESGPAALNQAITELMNEVANWRDGTIEIAERVARNAVAQTLDAWRPEKGLPASPPPAPPLAEAIREPDRDALEAVNLRLDEVVKRVGGFETRREISAPEPIATERVFEEGATRRLQEILQTSVPPEADRPLAPAPTDEVLLEPGAERPLGAPARPAEPEPATEPRDVKASFIAAARRAAQAAAADAEKSKPRRLGEASTLAGAGRATQVKSLLDRFRRPLIVSAAALVVAFGGYRLLRNEIAAPKPTQLAVAIPTTPAPSAPTISAPPSSGVAAPATPDPQTTQSVSPRSVATTPSVVLPPEAPAPVIAEGRDPKSVQTAPTNLASPAPGALPPPRTEAREPAPEAMKSQAQAPVASLTPTPLAPKPPASAADAPIAGLRLAAQNGDPAALYELATRTMEGRGIPRDPNAAFGLFERASEKNFAPAQYRLGNAYEKGIGVGRDLEAARKWYQRGAENGNTRSMHNLAVLMAEGVAGKPDYAAAIGWFQRAAEQGVRDSQFNLAVLFARGLGAAQDLVKSYTWFAIAAGQGDEEAGRKRDEVAARLSQPDLARAKTAVERWRVTPPKASANEVSVPPGGWTSEPGAKKPVRDPRA